MLTFRSGLSIIDILYNFLFKKSVYNEGIMKDTFEDCIPHKRYWPSTQNLVFAKTRFCKPFNKWVDQTPHHILNLIFFNISISPLSRQNT